MESQVLHYVAAGGVVVHGGRVLVLHRPKRNEVRLPKGHIEPGETAVDAALRETREETGYEGLVALADLGTQTVEFEHRGRRIVRAEHYYLMGLKGEPEELLIGGEVQFEPAWLRWGDALAALSFDPEREWVRRARRYMPILRDSARAMIR